MTGFFLDATISLSDLCQLLLALAGVAVLVALTVLIIKLIKILTNVNQIVSDLKSPVSECLESLPETMSNVNLIVGNFVDISDDIAETVTPLLASTAEIGNSTQVLLTQVSNTASEALLAVQRGIHFFDPKQRERRRGEKSSWGQLTKAAGSAYNTYRALKKAGVIKRK
ncbi:MAG: hypothetical protein Q4P72_01530 [Eubacteriales bacterium]|nr:hypothetical protein [Eubacteriales bacterium]